MDQEAELASQKISGKKIKKGYYLKPAEAIITCQVSLGCCDQSMNRLELIG